MSDNNENQASRREEQQDLEHQQKSLFDELSQEQREAERALQEDREPLASESPQKESDE